MKNNLENSDLSFQVIEPPIYKELNWDMELVMKALEYLCKKLPIYLIDLPKSTQYYLIVYGDFLGNKFPAIGVRSDDSKDYNMILDFLDLYDMVEKVINEELTIDEVKIKSLNEAVISWEELQKLKYYPS